MIAVIDSGRCAHIVARGPVTYVAHSVAVKTLGGLMAVRSIACLNTIQGRRSGILAPAEPPQPIP